VLSPEATVRVRKAWTLLDRAYTQYRRAITYLRYVEGDYWCRVCAAMRGRRDGAYPRRKRRR